MRLELSHEAVERLEAQLAYLIEAGAPQAADRLRQRVMQLLTDHLSRFPGTGRRLEIGELWEAWIPRTRLIVWYRIEGDRVLIATVWHAAQDRTGVPE